MNQNFQFHIPTQIIFGCGELRQLATLRLPGKKSQHADDFIEALLNMQKACGVDALKLSDWGVKIDEMPAMVQNARETMGGLFNFDPRETTDEELLAIYQKSFR